MTPAISVQDISKKYILGSEMIVGQSFREMLLSSFKSPLKRIKRLKGIDHDQEKFWALQNISFDVEQGSIVGFIGQNGAGKSTLLKVLSRITTPTTGQIKYYGRLASLLEVGTGFHPELTGRENIFLNGAILGMTRKEISSRVDEIVDFSGVEKFLDTPTKRFSSGMYVRLAFAVAAHLNPDILIVDEVLSVGDAEFQNKCIGKMSDTATEGRTVLFVSHNLATVRKLCNSVILLEQGTVRFQGKVAEGMAEYEKSVNSSMNSSIQNTFDQVQFKGTDRLKKLLSFKSLRVVQDGKDVGVVDVNKDLTLSLTIHTSCALAELGVKVSLFRDGIFITALFDTHKKVNQNNGQLQAGDFCSEFHLKSNVLTPGSYTLGIYMKEGSNEFVNAEHMAVLNTVNLGESLVDDRDHGSLRIDYQSSRYQPI